MICKFGTAFSDELFNILMQLYNALSFSRMIAFGTYCNN